MPDATGVRGLAGRRAGAVAAPRPRGPGALRRRARPRGQDERGLRCRGPRRGARAGVGGGVPGGAPEPLARGRPRRRARAVRALPRAPGRARAHARRGHPGADRARPPPARGSSRRHAGRRGRPRSCAPRSAAEPTSSDGCSRRRPAPPGRAVRCWSCWRGSRASGRRALLDEMLARLRLDGASVAAARAVEGDRGDPWSGVLALARGGLIDAAGVGGAPTAALAAFAALLPEWADRFPGARAPAATPARRGRWWRRCARPRRNSPSCSRSTTPSGWTPIPRSRSARCSGTCATSR